MSQSRVPGILIRRTVAAGATDNGYILHVLHVEEVLIAPRVLVFAGKGWIKGRTRSPSLAPRLSESLLHLPLRPEMHYHTNLCISFYVRFPFQLQRSCL